MYMLWILNFNVYLRILTKFLHNRSLFSNTFLLTARGGCNQVGARLGAMSKASGSVKTGV